MTVGYGDGTFRPSEPLSLWHATVFLNRYYEEILGADASEDFTRADMMRVLYEMAGGGETPDDATEDGDRAASPTGTAWLGTSTYDGESAGVVCGRGPAEFTWNLDTGGQRIKYLTVLIWSPPDRRVDIDVTGPNGATENIGREHGWASLLSFGDDPQAHIDAGETSFSVTPMKTWEERLAAGRSSGDYSQQPAPDAVWGVAGFVTSHSYLSTTSKLRQQWVLSVNCDQAEPS